MYLMFTTLRLCTLLLSAVWRLLFIEHLSFSAAPAWVKLLQHLVSIHFVCSMLTTGVLALKLSPEMNHLLGSEVIFLCGDRCLHSCDKMWEDCVVRVSDVGLLLTLIMAILGQLWIMLIVNVITIPSLIDKPNFTC